MVTREEAVKMEAETNEKWASLEKAFNENFAACGLDAMIGAELLQQHGLNFAGMALAAAMLRMASNSAMDEASD